ncbi:MAG TPA: SAM-dependent methyltransferase [Rhizomicrobium sp.]|nr:SAM-dependent methyltransferase [Rhizomicrobium sp.]
MNALGERIAALIAAQGPISIAEFMTIALHDPQAGYYATRDPLGASGDFITAPEISQMFGEFLGLWCVQVWHDQGKPAHKRLVELGPGRGTLMADALRAARVAPEFLDGLEIVLVEASPTLRAIQRENLKIWGDKIRWTAQFDDSLGDRPLYLLANEFFDALPIRQYVKGARGWCERMVAVDANGALDFALSPMPALDVTIPPDRAFAPDGGVYEVSPASLALVDEIARIVAHQSGGALIVDYGYDKPGFGETLQAVAEHEFAEVLADLGEGDLSAHVDFPSLAAHARAAGAEAYGPIGQGDFLEDLGLVHRAEHLRTKNPQVADEIWKAVTRLVAPEEMGTLFKALAIVPKNAPKPPGF